MFINYLRLNFLRYFKGRGAWTTLIFEVLFSFATLIPILLMIGLEGADSFHITTGENTEVNVVESYYFIMQIMFLFPIVIGLMGSRFVCSYYAYRSYNNLEIGMKHRGLFCLAELFTMYIMSLIILGIFYMICIFFDLILPDLGSSMLVGSPLYTISMIISMIAVLFNQTNDIFFFSKLIRTRGLSFLVFIIFEMFTSAINLLIPDKYELVRVALCPTFFTWFDGDTPLFFNEKNILIAVAVTGYLVKNIAQFIFSVMAFNRKQEERHR